jgi:hypothetical protein
MSYFRGGAFSLKETCSTYTGEENTKNKENSLSKYDKHTTAAFNSPFVGIFNVIVWDAKKIAHGHSNSD